MAANLQGERQHPDAAELAKLYADIAQKSGQVVSRFIERRANGTPLLFNDDVVVAFADMAGLRVSQVAMIGDNRHDLQAGRAAGAGLVVAVLSGTGTRESLEPLADVVLGSVADLPGFLAAGQAKADAPI